MENDGFQQGEKKYTYYMTIIINIYIIDTYPLYINICLCYNCCIAFY